MGPGAVNCAIQQSVGIDIDKASISNHVVLESQEFANQRVINLWVNSAECFDWLAEIEAKGVSRMLSQMWVWEPMVDMLPGRQG